MALQNWEQTSIGLNNKCYWVENERFKSLIMQCSLAGCIVNFITKLALSHLKSILIAD